MSQALNPGQRLERAEDIINRVGERLERVEAKMENMTPAGPDKIGLTVQLVSAYVSRNAVPMADLPKLVADTHHAIAQLDAPKDVSPASLARKEPAVPIKKSITDDFLICLEDGKKFKSLKRHLSTHYGLTPDAYREKWGLTADYPMVAPKYAEQRSTLAKKMGLGKKRAA